MSFVWAVYFSVQANQVNNFGHSATCKSPLEYVGNSTQLVKGQFQESWEAGEVIQ